jgi:deoxyribonuclease-1
VGCVAMGVGVAAYWLRLVVYSGLYGGCLMRSGQKPGFSWGVFVRGSFCCVLASVLTLLAVPAFAGQTMIRSYGVARDRFFYKRLYPHGGWTIYCGKRWRTKRGLNIEHIYPASWMAKHVGCGTRRRCQRGSQRFNFMEADLHNLYPSLARINQARSNYGYSLLPDTPGFVEWCDFRVRKSKKLVQPRRIARGNLARSIFYMHREYGLPVPQGMRGLLLRWHWSDRVSPHERRRNNAIERLQGTRNPFIDNPCLANSLGFGS